MTTFDMPAFIGRIKHRSPTSSYTNDDMEAFINAIMADKIDGVQLGAWLAFVCVNGLTNLEAAAMTMAMARSGDMIIDLPGRVPGPTLDKHSTGGVGDDATIVFLPVAAALGLYQLKLSGAALGFTGGTTTKLRSIPGFNVELPIDALMEQTERIGLSLGSTGDLAPADKIIYGARDLSNTIDNIGLIAASIMSKKIAAGAEHIVLNVTYGSGAFMHELKDARELARQMASIGRACGRRVVAVVTDMNRPLSDGVGNSLAVIQSIEVLKGAGSPRLRALVVELLAQSLVLTGQVPALHSGRKMAMESIDSGLALSEFAKWVHAQGGNPRIVDDYGLLLNPAIRTKGILADRSGYITEINPMSIALGVNKLGAGREVSTDVIDLHVGLEIHVALQQQVSAGERLATIHYNPKGKGLDDAAYDRMTSAFWIEEAPVEAPPLIVETF